MNRNTITDEDFLDKQKRFRFVLIGVIFLVFSIIVSTISFITPKTKSPAIRSRDLVIINSDDWSCHHDSIGNMIIEGKIDNSSDSITLDTVLLRGYVKDKDGKVLNTGTSSIDSDILLPSSSSTFTIYLNDPDYLGTDCSLLVDYVGLE